MKKSRKHRGFDARRRFFQDPFFRACQHGLEHLEERRLLSATPLTTAQLSAHQVTPAWFAAVADPAQTTQLGQVFLDSVDTADETTNRSDQSRWIVQLTDDALADYPTPAATAALFAGTELEILSGLGLPGQLLVGAHCTTTGQAIEFLADHPDIRYFEADSVHVASATPNDPLFDQQFGLHNTGQGGGIVDADIDAPEAWEITTGSRDVVVAVIDSGIDYTHPDLAANIWTNPGEIAGNSIDDDNNGFVDDVHGWDFHNNDADPMDDHGHGTHVAGTIGAVGNNNLGVTGVSQQASLMALKFLNKSNVGYSSDAVRALNYMTMMHTNFDTNVLVSNNSWETVNSSVSLYESAQATNEAGILLVAAAGNGWLRGGNLDHDPHFPASYNLPNIISVAASDQYDRVARFSNYGPDTVHIAAPGVSVYSTYPIRTDRDSYGSDSGTSMAAPHVSGTAALVWAHLPDATVEEVRNAILQGADSLPTIETKVMGGQRLNAAGALTTDTYHPRASAAPPANITTPGGANHLINVNYLDNHALAHASLDNGDLTAKRLQDNKALEVRLKSVSSGSNSPALTATYELLAPTGAWSTADNGLYEVGLNATQVLDTAGLAAQPGSLLQFEINIVGATNFTVNTFADTVDVAPGNGFVRDANNQQSLRAAIQETNALAGTNTIHVPAGSYQFSLTGADEDSAATGDLDIKDNLNIITDGTVTFDAADIDRIFDVHPGVTLNLDGALLTGGNTSSAGGAMRIRGSHVHLNHVTLADNQADSGGAISTDDAATVTINSSTFSGNQAANGAAILNTGSTLTLTSTTITENTALIGGGVFNSNGTFHLKNTIIAGNIGSTSDPDVRGNITTAGNNLIGIIGTASGVSHGTLGDLVGTSAAPIDSLLEPLTSNHGNQPTHLPAYGSPAIDAGNNSETDTQDQRGITRIHDADGDGRPTIDIGSVERYYARIQGTKFHDIDGDSVQDPGEPPVEGWGIFLDTNGNRELDPDETLVMTDENGEYAFPGLLAGNYSVVELSQSGWKQTLPVEEISRAEETSSSLAYQYVVTTTDDTPDALPGDGNALDVNGNTSLRAAIMEANHAQRPVIITLPAGTYPLTLEGTHEDAAATGDLDILASVTIQGDGSATTLVDGINKSRHFQVHPDASLVLNDISLTKGKQPDHASDHSGGSIHVHDNSSLAINRSTVSSNEAKNGAAIYNQGTSSVIDTTISANTATDHGGGIDNTNTLTVRRSTLSGNQANQNAGLRNLSGQATIDTSTFSNNQAANSGGAIGNHITGGNSTPHIVITASTLYGNSAGSTGGGIHSTAGTVTIGTSIVAGNAGGDLKGAFTSDGNNLIGSLGDASGFSNGTNNDLVNPGGNLGIGPLQDNGGFTLTHSPLPNSPALEHVSIPIDLVSLDQTGNTRVQPSTPRELDAGKLVSTETYRPWFVTAIDLDQDGDQDLISAASTNDWAVSGHENESVIHWHENLGDDTFATHVVTTLADDPRAVAAADLDGDGDMDIVSASQDDNTIAWYANNGHQVFTRNIIFTGANGADQVITGDVDNDGDIDLMSVSVNDQKLRWHKNDGNGTFSTHDISNNGQSRSLQFIDVNRDGIKDIVTSGSEDVWWYQNDGSGTFTRHLVGTGRVRFRSVVAGDIDGDQDIDVVAAANGDGLITFYRNDGNNEFSEMLLEQVDAPFGASLTMGDLDQDGDLDIIAGTMGSQWNVDAGLSEIIQLTNDGLGRFRQSLVATGLVHPASVITADIDGDGALDVVTADLGANQITRHLSRTAADIGAVEFQDVVYFTVNTVLDTPDATPGDGLAQDSDGNTSVRAAIMESNALGGRAQITVHTDKYTLHRAGLNEDLADTGDLDITSDVTIVGGDSAGSILDGGYNDRVFDVKQDAALTLRAVTVKNGTANYGGGIASVGKLTITDSQLFNNTSTQTGGGAIHHDNADENVIVNQTSFADNKSTIFGGAIAILAGNISVIDSTFHGNFAENTGAKATGKVTITNTANLAANTHSITITASDGTKITATAVASGGTTTAHDTNSPTFAIVNGNIGSTGENLARCLAATSRLNAWTSNGVVTIEQLVGGSSGNTSIVLTDPGSSGMSKTDFTNGSGSGSGSGGAIYITDNSTMSIANSTFSGNRANGHNGGAIMVDSGNSATIVTSSTFTDNQAVNQGGAIFSEQTVVLGNSIVAGNHAGASAADIQRGTNIPANHPLIFSRGSNFIGSSEGHSITDGTSDDHVGTSQTPLDPELSTSQQITHTSSGTAFHKPLPGSPVLDGGSYLRTTDDTFVHSFRMHSSAHQEHLFQTTNATSGGDAGAKYWHPTDATAWAEIIYKYETDTAFEFAHLMADVATTLSSEQATLEISADGVDWTTVTRVGYDDDISLDYSSTGNITPILQGSQRAFVRARLYAAGGAPTNARFLTTPNNQVEPAYSLVLGTADPSDTDDLDQIGTPRSLNAFVIPKLTQVYESLPTGGGAVEVIHFDIDNDGDQDLISSHVYANKIILHENNGNMSFTQNTILGGPVLSTPQAIYAIDFDGDHDGDIISGNTGSDKILLHLNNGDGSYLTKDVGTANDSQSVFVIDLDLDDDFDILSASATDNTVAWFENTGSHNFTKHVIASDAGGARKVFASDLDADGDIDVFSATVGDGKCVSWYENNGNQSFTRHVVDSRDPQTWALDVLTDDVNQDGYLDIVSVDPFTDSVYWHENVGDASFIRHTVDDNIDNPGGVHVADLDGDGDRDILSFSWHAGTVVSYINNGSQGFTRHFVSTTLAADSPRDVIAVDLDNDGLLEVVAVSFATDEVIVWENTTTYYDIGAIELDPNVDIRGTIRHDIDSDGQHGWRKEFDFSSDPGWTKTGATAYGYSATNHANPSAATGEIGGTFTRAAAYGYYATTDFPEELDFNQSFSASGLLDVPDTGSVNHGMTVGFFNHLQFENPGYRHDGIVYRGVARVNLVPNACLEGPDLLSACLVLENLDSSAPRTWALQYDPVGPVGHGQLRFEISGPAKVDTNYSDRPGTVTASNTGGTITVDFTAEQRRLSRPLTAFGLQSYEHLGPDPASFHHDVYIDDVVLTGGNEPGIDGWTVFLDNNNNGQVDPGEPATLTAGDNPATEGDETGQYSFENLRPGDYRVRTRPAVNWELELPNDYEYERIANYVVDAEPFDVESGDLDNDGDIDLVVSIGGNLDQVEVLLNTGTGKFTRGPTLPVSGDSRSVRLGDVDRDGDLDIVAIGFHSNNVYVSLNHGDATFTSPVSYGLPGSPLNLDLADIDNDNDIDIVVGAAYTNQRVSTLKNNGNGTFANYVGIDLPNAAEVVVAGDLDGDGDADLAVANYANDTVVVLRNSGDGSFAVAGTFAAGDGPRSISIADVDLDGDADIIVVNRLPDTSNSTVSILKNTGNLSFATPLNFTGGVAADINSLKIADMDHDGDPDLAITFVGTDNLKIYTNDGTGSFTITTSIQTGSGPEGITLADLDNDGDADIALANRVSQNVVIFQNQLATHNLSIPISTDAPHTDFLAISHASDENSVGPQEMICDFDGNCPNFEEFYVHSRVYGGIQSSGGIDGNYLRLTNNVAQGSGGETAVTFDRVAKHARDELTVDFDFRIGSHHIAPADGFVVAVVPTSVYGNTGSIDQPLHPKWHGLDDGLTVSLQTFETRTIRINNGLNEYTTHTHAVLSETISGDWLHWTMKLTAEGRDQLLDIWITDTSQVTHHVVEGYRFTDFPSFESRLALFSKVGAVGSAHDFDNVKVTYGSPLYAAFDDAFETTNNSPITLPRTALTSNDFPSDPNWNNYFGDLNGNNFGYQASSSFAGGTAGELGGRFARSAQKRILADFELKDALTLDRTIAASGKIDVTGWNNPDLDDGLMIGHFNNDIHGLDHRGIGIGFGYENNQLVWFGRLRLADKSMIDFGHSIISDTDTNRTWSYDWNPTSGSNGTYILNLNGITHTLELSEAERAVGFGPVAAFGIHALPAADADSTKYIDLYLDDVTYTHRERRGVVDNDIGITDNSSLYWTDTAQGTIFRGSAGGSSITPLLTGLDRPTGLLVDTDHGRLIWAELGTQRLRRASLNGTYVTDILTTNVGDPRGLALDASNGQLFWTDAATREIKTVNVDGTDFDTLATSTKASPRGIQYHDAESTLYWANDTAVEKLSLLPNGYDPNNSDGTLHRWTTGNGGNGNWYEAVASTEAISWEDARQQAASRGGYLATLTSTAENDWVYENLVNDPDLWPTRFGPWIGGIQDTNNAGFSEPTGGWTWHTGETWTDTNWAPNAPNNNLSVAAENYLHFVHPTHARTPHHLWDDLHLSGESANNVNKVHAYIVEYDTTSIETVSTIPAGGALIDVAIDSANSMLYTTETRDEGGAIRSSTLAGANPATILTFTNARPEEITVDAANQHLYWIDSVTDTVNQASVNGTGSQAIATVGPGAGNIHKARPLAISLDFSNNLKTYLSTPPSHGSAILKTDGTFNYTPDEGFIGTDSFTYQLTDALNISEQATVTIDVRAGDNTETLLAEGSWNVSLHAGQVAAEMDFGNQAQLGTIAGVLFDDRDRDGLKHENEEMLAERTVYIDVNKDGDKDSNEPISVTDSHGHYQFTDLAPLTTYQLRQILPTEWLESTPGEDLANSWSVPLGAGQVIDDLAFGSYRTNATGSSLRGVLKGIHFNDDNTNRIQDVGEVPIAGTTVFLDLNRDGIMTGDEDTGEPRVTTDANGRYTFNGLDYGTYRVGIVLTAGESQTYPVTNSLSPADLDAGRNPRTTEASDINGDGFPDILVANAGSNDLSVLLADQEGGYLDPVHYPVGTYPTAVLVGQFTDDNGDDQITAADRPDVFVTNNYSSSISFLSNQGAGSLAEPVHIATGWGPNGMASADFNANGKPDIAVAQEFSDKVAILMNSGSGPSTITHQYSVGDAPVAIAAARIDSDNYTDLVTANFDGNNVSVLRGKGNGEFHDAVDYKVGTKPFSLTIADLNNDGHNDITVANVVSESISVLFGKNDGTLASAIHLSAGTSPSAIRAADMDLDGDLDLVVSNSGQSGVTILHNLGMGVFSKPKTFGAGRFSLAMPYTLTIRDMNQDSIPDVLVATGANNSVSLFTNSLIADTHEVKITSAVETIDNLTFGTITSNQPPTINALVDATIPEDSPQQTASLSGVTAGPGETQHLQVTASSSDTALIPDPAVTYTDGQATGSLTYTPLPNAFGSAIITVTVTDGGADNNLATAEDNASTSQQFTVTVSSVNDPPTLGTIATPAAIDEDSSQKTVNFSGITAGGGETQHLRVTASSNNTALVPEPAVTYTDGQATGSLTYTPLPNAFGSAIITVTVTDAGADNKLETTSDNLTTSQQFTIGVNPLNDPPTLGTIATPAAIDEDAAEQTVNFSGVTAGPGETQHLQVTASSNNTALVSDPAVTYTDGAATGSLTYTPLPNAFGSAIITVTVTDGGDDNKLETTGDNLTTSQQFTIGVNPLNDPPTLATIIDPAAIDEDVAEQTVNFSGITAGPGETQHLAVTASSNNTALIPDPTVTYTDGAATGSLKYTPLPNAFGSAMITVTVTDGGADNKLETASDNLTTSQQFTVNVNPLNDPPTLGTIANPAAIDEDVAEQTVNFSGVTAGPGETQHLRVTASSNNTALVSDPAVTYTDGQAAGSLTYTPIPNAFGSATITVTVTDGGADNNLATAGDNASTSQQFSVNVGPLNDSPTLNMLADHTIDEDSTQQTANFSGVTAGPGETQHLRVSATSGNTSLVADPTVTYTDGQATGSLTYTPLPNAFGSAIITVTVTDGGADNNLATAGDNASTSQQFTVNVAPLNDSPTLNMLADHTIDEDSTQQTANFSGVTAGPGETQHLRVTASSNNTALVSDPAVTYTDGQAAGSLTYTPLPNAFGSAMITVTVTDGGADNNLATAGDNASTSQQFTVNVGPLNDSPTLNMLADHTIDEDSTQQTANFSGVTAGPGETQHLRVSATSGNTSLVADPTVTYTDGAATGSLNYTPLPNAFGSAIITVTVTDGGADNNLATAGDNASTSQQFTVNVGPLNDSPTLNMLADHTIDEDSTQQTASFSGVTAGPGETQHLRVTASSGNTSLVADPAVTYTDGQATGSLDYTPLPNAFGSAIITVTVTDGGADNNLATAGDNASTSQQFTVNVGPLNDSPTLNMLADHTIDEDSTQQTANFSGVTAGPGETQHLRVTASSGNTALLADPAVTYTDGAATGSLNYTPLPNAFGSAIITVTVTDGGADNNLATAGDNASTSQQFTVNVGPLNDSPTLNMLADHTIDEDSTQQTASFSGVTAGPGETQHLRVTASSGNTALLADPAVTYTDGAATGSLNYTPLPNAFGSAIITVTVTDGGADNNLATAGDNASTSQQFTVNVNAINDTPTLDSISNQSITDLAPEQTIPLTGITAGLGETQHLRVSAVSSNTMLLSTPPVQYISAESTGTLKYRPLAGVSGATTITVTVTDAGNDNNLATAADNRSVSQDFTVTVSIGNALPTLAGISTTTIDEDAPLQTVQLSNITAGGGDDQPLLVTATSSNTDLIPHPSVSYTSPQATGNISFQGVADGFGSSVITVTVTDGGPDKNLETAADNASFQQSFTVNINSVNDKPVSGSATFEPAQDITVSVDKDHGLLAISSDVEDDNLTFTIVTSTDHGVLTTSADGRFTYQPNQGFNRSDFFTYRLNDGQAEHNFSDLARIDFHIDTPHAWYNSLKPLDVNDDTFTTPLDVLWIINNLNANGSGTLVNARSKPLAAPFYDVNKDGVAAPLDALIIINALNQGAGEGEGASSRGYYETPLSTGPLNVAPVRSAASTTTATTPAAATELLPHDDAYRTAALSDQAADLLGDRDTARHWEAAVDQLLEEELDLFGDNLPGDDESP